MSGPANPTNGIRKKPVWLGLRDAISSAWAQCIQFLYQHTILVLTIMFCATMVAAAWHLTRISIGLIQTAAEQGTSLYADALQEVRKLYTSEVVDRLVDRVHVTHDYATREGAIPLPITFSMELGKRVSKESTGMRARLYSDFPFPTRKDGGPRG